MAARSLSGFLTRVRLQKLSTSQRAENTPAVIQKRHIPPKYVGIRNVKTTKPIHITFMLDEHADKWTAPASGLEVDVNAHGKWTDLKD